MKISKLASTITLMSAICASPALAQDIEPALDAPAEAMSAAQDNNQAGDVSDDSGFSVSGFVEAAGSASLRPFDKSEISECGGRIKVKPEYRISNYTLFADLDYFANSGSAFETRETNTIEAVELNIRGGKTLRWCAGKQRFLWGAGDTFQPSNFIDRPDLREAFSRDLDDRYSGVYAISLKYIFGDYGIEAALRPVTESALAPAGFFAQTPQAIETPAGTLDTRYATQQTETALVKSSFGIRAGGTSGIFDWHLVYYNGIQNLLLYGTKLVTDESGDTFVEAGEVRQHVNAFGADLSFAVDKWNLRAEAAFSHDMTAVRKASEDNFGAIYARAAEQGSAAIQDATRRPFASYSAGFDYNLWGNYGMIYAEWMQARYLRESGVEAVLQSDILLVRIEDKYLDEALTLKLQSMTCLREKKPGLSFNAEALYDFKIGLTASMGLWYFIANDDEYTAMFEDRRMIYANVRYNF